MQIRSLEKRVRKAYSILESCRVCPRKCEINRLKGERGFCGMGRELVVSSFNVHYGEEPPISGEFGSGTIFFTGCNLRCVYCQNFPISHLRHGKKTSSQGLAEMMLSLEDRGCHNVNFVTPTHFVPQIVEGITLAKKHGFSLPLVYNSSGYDAKATLELLDGIIDVYLVDMRYSDNQTAEKFSNASDYVKVNREAVKEMYRQVGDLTLNDLGLAQRGLIIRHLVFPDDLAGSNQTFQFIAKNISAQTYVSLMSQYFPAYQAQKHAGLNRRITEKEYEKAKTGFFEAGLSNGWIQEEESLILEGVE